MKEITVDVAISVDVQCDLTKVSVRTELTEPLFGLEVYNIAFETDSIKDLGSAKSDDYFQRIDDKLDSKAYFPLGSREYALSRLSDYLKGKIFDCVDLLLKPDLANFVVKYRIIVDYSLGLKRLGDSITFMSDALALDPDRAWMIERLDTLVVLDSLDLGANLYSPISHTNEMIRHMRQ